MNTIKQLFFHNKIDWLFITLAISATIGIYAWIKFLKFVANDCFKEEILSWKFIISKYIVALIQMMIGSLMIIFIMFFSIMKNILDFFIPLNLISVFVISIEFYKNLQSNQKNKVLNILVWPMAILLVLVFVVLPLYALIDKFFLNK